MAREDRKKKLGRDLLFLLINGVSVGMESVIKPWWCNAFFRGECGVTEFAKTIKRIVFYFKSKSFIFVKIKF
jgi:hypothetical protein